MGERGKRELTGGFDGAGRELKASGGTVKRGECTLGS